MTSLERQNDVYRPLRQRPRDVKSTLKVSLPLLNSFSTGFDHRLKTMATPTKDEFLGNLQPADCAICLQTFDIEHVPIQLPCFHVVGADCVANLAESSNPTNNQCPLCRRVLFEQEDYDAQGHPLHAGARDPEFEEMDSDGEEEEHEEIDHLALSDLEDLDDWEDLSVFYGIITHSDSSGGPCSDSEDDVEDANADEAVVRDQEERSQMAQVERRVGRVPEARMQPNVPRDQDKDSTESADDEDSDGSDTDEEEDSENGDSDSKREDEDVEMEEADDEDSSVQETIEMIVQELVDDEMEDSSSEDTSSEYVPDEDSDDEDSDIYV